MLAHALYTGRQPGRVAPCSLLKAVCWCLQLGCLPRAVLAGTQAAAQVDLKEIQLQLMMHQWWELLASHKLPAGAWHTAAAELLYAQPQTPLACSYMSLPA